MTTFTTRAKEVAARKMWPGLYDVDYIEIFDEISPGWKRAKIHWIYGAKDYPDIVYELPGRIFVRGWDYTGAINKKKR